MISGAHVVVYSKDAEADRAFFSDILGFPSVDAGHGWLIFALPPAEAALRAKGIKCSEVIEARWGSITKIRLPGGGEIGLYKPKHPTTLGMKSK